MKYKETWFDEIHQNSRYGLKGKLIEEKTSPYQNIKIIKTKKYGNALMLDECWMTSEKQDQYYHECFVHPALSSLYKVAKILIIGGGDGGTAKECLKYKEVKNIDLVEIDEDVINLSRKHLKNIGEDIWNNKKLKIHIQDGVEWVKKIEDNFYDAIFIDSSDPSGFSNGLFSKTFYIDCRRILKAQGIFAAQSESPESFKIIHLKIIKLLKEVFSNTVTLYSFVPFYPSGVWSWTFTSENCSDFLSAKYKNVDLIEKSCDIWNLNYQEGSIKMIPNKILKEIY